MYLIQNLFLRIIFKKHFPIDLKIFVLKVYKNYNEMFKNKTSNNVNAPGKSSSKTALLKILTRENF